MLVLVKLYIIQGGVFFNENKVIKAKLINQYKFHNLIGLSVFVKYFSNGWWESYFFDNNLIDWSLWDVDE